MNDLSRRAFAKKGPTIKKHETLGRIIIAGHVDANQTPPGRARTIILLLAASVALMMTGFGIIMPVFARRLGEFGDGVEALGVMTMAFALTQLIAAPIAGSWADRWGRRPFVLVALAAFMLTNIGYLLAKTTPMFILVRALGGLFTAGLFPAAMGIVADIVPEDQRARWIGIVMGGYGAGFVFGPVLGGFLYDGWGFAAPFTTSAGLAFLGLTAAAILVPETRPQQVRRRAALRKRRDTAVHPPQSSLWQTLPRPLTVFASLVFIDFIGAFAFAFVEPQMVFYFYEDLGWSTLQFGVVVGIYGLAMVFGQTVLGQSSDRYGRKPVIVIGVLMSTILYISLAYVRAFPLIVVSAITAGLGSALIAPALSAFILDITAEQHRGRIVGIKESALALGGVLGPLLVAVMTNITSPQGIFVTAGGLVLSGAILAILFLRQPEKIPVERDNLAWEVAQQRCLAAQATLSGLVMSAARIRQRRFQGVGRVAEFG